MGDGLLDGLTSEQVHMVRHLVELLRRANESLARAPVVAQASVVAPGVVGVHPRSLLSVTEAAGMLGIGRTHVFQLLGRGDLESVSIGRRRLSRCRQLNGTCDR